MAMMLTKIMSKINALIF